MIVRLALKSNAVSLSSKIKYCRYSQETLSGHLCNNPIPAVCFQVKLLMYNANILVQNMLGIMRPH
jgi:hypothetical protein